MTEVQKPEPSNPVSRQYRAWRRWRRRHRATLLLVAALILPVISPIEDYWRYADFLLAPAGLVLVLALVQPGAEGRRTALALSILAVCWVASIAAYDIWHVGEPYPAVMILGLSLIVLRTIARQIIRATSPNWDTLSAALTGYLFIAVAWGQVYYLIFLAAPDSFIIHGHLQTNPVLFLYFSFQTLTTLGYGDIAPANPFTGMLASMEAIIGQFYIATVIARLVSLAHRPPEKN